MKILDLSVPLANDVPADPPFQKVSIEYTGHDEGAFELAAAFPGLEPTQLPDGKGWAVERVHISTHNGTHMDAPWHYHPTMDGGQRAITIDEVPLDWCMRPGVRLDFRDLPDGYVVTPEDVDRELARIDHHLQPLDIVVCATGAGARYGHEDYIHSGCGCGFGRDATLHLLEQGVRIVGTDGWSWDAPFSATLQRFVRDGDPSVVWEGHKAGRERGYCQLEKLHRLEQLPDSGFTVVCFPVSIQAASAGWTRAVALLEDD
ncbi:cyclase family protein [Pseudonocardia kujensis]|uniref:cyclase family protein n=1 Tax=Pseudonocardia kujensis TaxID=1128675 RepID=UPI0027DFCA47|nr:cyclase family protein [Pseudonocardia kujensis]